MPELTEEDLKNMSPEQIAELQKQNCIFCHIISGKIPSHKVYEDEQCLAILDINPAAKGHMLLMPKQHYMIFPQMPEPLIKHLAKISKLLSKKAIKLLGATGTNIFVANGAIAGQRAPHVMIHIIPRNDNDGITCFELPERNISPEDMSRMQNVLASKFGTKVEIKEKQETTENQKEKPKQLKEINLKELKEMLE